MTTTVVALKLPSGEEWIGKHVETIDESIVKLEDPRKVQIVNNGKGGLGLALTPIFACSNDLNQITLGKHHVVSIIAVDTDFAKQYRQEVSSIQLI